MKVALGLGSNEGDRLAYLRSAIGLLSREVRVLRASPVYESQAMLPAEAPSDGSWDRPFLNLALECETSLSPEALLALLKRVEQKVGRESRSRWAPRPIDVDILASDGPAVSSPGLVIPHPGLLGRPFALLPLADLWPDLRVDGASAAHRAAAWRFEAPEQVPFGTRPTGLALTELVGILNVTPDSFSDGGAYFDPARACERALVLARAGARVVDIGAESTRPGAAAISADEEWRRLAPVLDALGGAHESLKISVDTRHVETARRALSAGAAWVNDVTGFESAELRRAVADSPAELVVMHSLGIPPDSSHTLPPGKDPIEELLSWGEKKLRTFEGEGISRERVILDPGIGFGKLAFQSWLVLEGIGRLHELGCRVLVGASRKSFLSLVTDLPAAERDLESSVIAARLAAEGVQYIRVHDVSGAFRALQAASRLGGITRWRS